MRFNGRCTVWHKTDEGYITLHYPCWWQDTEAVNISKSGKTDVDTAAVYLPLAAEVAKSDYIAKGDTCKVQREQDFTKSLQTKMMKTVTNRQVEYR